MKRPAKPPRLNGDRIVATALSLIDRFGLEALSTRRLAAELGIEAMSLYHHFPSKGHLLDAVTAALVLEIELPALPLAGPASSVPALATLLAEMARRYRQVARAHPNAFVLMATRRFNSPGSLRFLEAVLGLLERSGLDVRDCTHLCRLFGYYVNGAGLAEISARGQEPDSAPERLLQGSDGPVQFPRSRELASTVTSDDLDVIFEEGLQLLIAEFQRRAHEQNL